MAEIGLLALMPDPWGDYWGSRHHMLSRISSWFHVVWVDPPLEWREAWRPGRPKRALPGGQPPASPGFARYEPSRWLPHFYRPPVLSQWASRLRWQQARAILERRGCRQIVLDLWRPQFEPALDCLPHDLSCYHITDEYSYSEEEGPVDSRERDLIARVGQVFILSRTTFAKKARYNANSLYLPTGVDYQAFTTQHREPDDLASIPSPRIGYAGYIKRFLDFDLVRTLAERHRDWSFVLIGPESHLGDRAELARRLRALPNVYFLGGVRREELPAYDQHFDVCMLCYAVNGYTKFVNPLKLKEYLASGRPVVGAPLPAFEEFADVVELARTPEEWSMALERALAPAASSPERVEGRRDVARRCDWQQLVDRMAETICERLGGAALERFRAIQASAAPAGATQASRMEGSIE